MNQVVVVDNGSTDPTCHIAKHHPIEPTTLVHQQNLGFAEASNRGLQVLTTDYKLCLNDDAYLTPGYISTLVSVLERSPNAASAVGKMVCHHGGQAFIDSAGIEIDYRRLSPEDRGYGEIDIGQYDARELIFGPSAAAALYRSTALDSLMAPPFDPNLFAYYEDVDLAWRLTRQGWNHIYEPSAVVHHCRRGPANKPPQIRARAFGNRYLVWSKNESLRSFASYGVAALAWEGLRIGNRLLKQPSELACVPSALRSSAAIVLRRIFSA